MNNRVHIFNSYDDIQDHLIDYLKNELKRIPDNQTISIALSGGSTPKKLFIRMSKEIEKDLLQRAVFLQVDERHVPADNNDSNQKMIYDTLINPLNLPDKNFIKINTNMPHNESAIEYEKRLLSDSRLNINSENTLIVDIILLGMGADGHTASLFTQQDCLLSGTAVATRPAELPHDRISLSYRTIKNGKNLFFVVTGSSKADRLKEVLMTQSNVPAALVFQENFDSIFLLDNDAAINLT
jgi:6-phosphogluconolactonase